MESSLPELVRAYLARSIGGEPRTCHALRLQQVGEMLLEPGAKPRAFTATEELLVDRVGFVWRARFPIFGPLSMRVSDSYDEGAGRLDVRLLGFPLQRRRGAGLARGEALRYLAEIPWVPHAILANPELCWSAVDEQTVEVATTVAGERVAVRLVFDEAGDIVRTIADRPRLEDGGEITTWVGEFSGYTHFDDVRLPTRGEVRWVLPDGPFTYWQGTITSVEVVA